MSVSFLLYPAWQQSAEPGDFHEKFIAATSRICAIIANVLDFISNLISLPERLLTTLVRIAVSLEAIAKEIHTMSANLDANLDALSDAITTELQQLRDAIAASASGQEALAAVDRANARLTPLIDALKSDDPTPPAPAE